MAQLLERCIRVTIALDTRAQDIGGQAIQPFLSGNNIVIEGTGTGDDFTIECQVAKVIGQTRPTADLTIYGLSEAIISVLSHINYYPMQQVYFNSITIEAGYDFNYSTIFIGNIINAVPDYNDPSTAFHIQALAHYFDQILQAPNYNPKGTQPVKSIITSIASQSQQPLSVNATGIDYLTGNNPLYTGSTVQQLEQVANDYNLNLQIDNNVVYVSPRGTALTTIPTLEINADNILYGYPTLEQYGCTCRVMYTPNLFFGQKIHIESIVPIVTGDWINVAMYYDLRNRGNKFEIELKNMKYGFLNNV